MDVVYERCAGIDISKADVKVCIRVPGTGRRRHREVRTFTTMTEDLLAMRDWLLDQRVEVVGMEATGAYWKPIHDLLNGIAVFFVKAERHGFHLLGGRARLSFVTDYQAREASTEEPYLEIG